MSLSIAMLPVSIVAAACHSRRGSSIYFRADIINVFLYFDVKSTLHSFSRKLSFRFICHDVQLSLVSANWAWYIRGIAFCIQLSTWEKEPKKVKQKLIDGKKSPNTAPHNVVFKTKSLGIGQVWESVHNNRMKKWGKKGSSGSWHFKSTVNQRGILPHIVSWGALRTPFLSLLVGCLFCAHCTTKQLFFQRQNQWQVWV